MFDPLTTTASDLEKLLNAGETTSIKLIDTYLGQIVKYNGYLHAVISTAPKDLLTQRAQSLDHERAEGKVRGPLHGIPILIKDNIATDPMSGMEMTAGALALVGSKSKKAAKIVELLEDAGAIILAKANLSELCNYRGNGIFGGWSTVGGQTQSAYVEGGLRDNDSHNGNSGPSGSSSGSAVGVSAGFAPIAIGTETVGSLVIPANRAALYTMKPTLNVVSRDGICPVSLAFDSAGPMTKSVLDLANILDVIVDPKLTKNVPDTGYASRVNASWKYISIGVLPAELWDIPADMFPYEKNFYVQMREETNAAYERLRQFGVTVKNVQLSQLSELFIDGEEIWKLVTEATFEEDINTFLKDLDVSDVRSLQELVDFNTQHAHATIPGPRYNQELLEDALKKRFSAEEAEALTKRMHAWYRKTTDDCMKKNEINIILGPAESAHHTRGCSSGYPTGTVPLGYSDVNGRAFGLCILGAPHSEALMLQFMSAWETSMHQRQVPKSLSG